MSIESRFRAFIEAGYRPNLKSHIVHRGDRETDRWATLHWREYITGKDRQPVFLSDMHADPIGWSIDAFSVNPGEQAIHGGVFPTVEEALAYSEKELAKVLALRGA